jgi:hypothetical protein
MLNKVLISKTLNMLEWEDRTPLSSNDSMVFYTDYSLDRVAIII